MKSFGVIGVGRWGPNIIGSLNQIDKVHVSHVCDTNEDNLSIISKIVWSIINCNKDKSKK